jgi:hypothetical protein
LESIYMNKISALMYNFPNFQATFTFNTCAFIVPKYRKHFQPAFHA